MVKDERTSRSPKSGTASFGSGDSGTSKDVITIRDAISVSAKTILITYDTNATNEAKVELYDDVEGTSEADLSNKEFTATISPGDKIDLTGVEGIDFDDDVVSVVRNNDDDMEITVVGLSIEG